MSRKLVDANGRPMEGVTKMSQELLPDWQQGIIIRKYLDQNINRWMVGFGVRNTEQEVMLGFTYEEGVQIVSTLMRILDGFTTEEKTRGVRK